MRRRLFVVLLFALSGSESFAQNAAPAAPAIRRWIDLQNVHLSSRFRWVEASDGGLTSSTHQWQPNVRARFLLDATAKYSVHVGVFGGNQFVSSWNNTGGGMGRVTHDVNVKQLFVVAAPLESFELQLGGLYPTRGENTEITSYDNDGYIVGERVTLRPPAGLVSQIAGTVGHIGDYRTPNVFARLDSLGDVNYGQVLVALRLGRRVNMSADYTYQDERSIIREGISVRTPEGASPLTAIRFDAYQRVSDITGQGFNVSGDLRLTPALTVTAGVAHVDQFYAIPGYVSPNADRFERGTRFYSQANYTLTRDLSVGWFHGEAFNVDYPIPNEHRWEVLVTINPTATLKAHRVF